MRNGKICKQPRDLGLCAHVRSPHFLVPALYLYDNVHGGVGLSELLYEAHREVLAAALEVVMRCECRSGCPVCVGPPEEVGALGKSTAQAILEHLCSDEPPMECDLALTLAGEP